jgi:hypothetical protein
LIGADELEMLNFIHSFLLGVARPAEKLNPPVGSGGLLKLRTYWNAISYPRARMRTSPLPNGLAGKTLE